MASDTYGIDFALSGLAALGLLLHRALPYVAGLRPFRAWPSMSLQFYIKSNFERVYFKRNNPPNSITNKAPTGRNILTQGKALCIEKVNETKP
jgi:hypothetical protein